MSPGHFPLRIIQYGSEKGPLAMPLLQGLHSILMVFNGCINSFCQTIPTGRIVSHLCPGKNPGYGPQGIKGHIIGGTTWYRPGCDRQFPDVFNRRDGRIPVPEIRVIDQFAIGIHWAVSDLLNYCPFTFLSGQITGDLLILCHRYRCHSIHDLLQMPMGNRWQHVTEWDHLSLLSKPDPSIVCHGRHSYNSLIGLTSATPNGSASPMK